MTCNCCSKRKKLFEKFQKTGGYGVSLVLCDDCLSQIDKVRASAKSGRSVDTAVQKKRLETRKDRPTEDYLTWEKQFYHSLGID